jgi:hypothetical protein
MNESDSLNLSLVSVYFKEKGLKEYANIYKPLRPELNFFTSLKNRFFAENLQAWKSCKERRSANC